MSSILWQLAMVDRPRYHQVGRKVESLPDGHRIKIGRTRYVVRHRVYGGVALELI